MSDMITIHPDDRTVEEYLTDKMAHDHVELNAVPNNDPKEYQRQILETVRIVMNLCLFAMDRGLRGVPKPPDPRAERRARKAKKDPRMARLQEREIREIEVQDLHLILAAHAPAGPPVEGSGGWKVKMHRRRGHWRMQACGKGRTQVKRIYIHSFMINDHDGDGKVDTILH